MTDYPLANLRLHVPLATAIIGFASAATAQVCTDWSIVANPVSGGQEFRPSMVLPFGPDSAMSLRRVGQAIERHVWDGSSWTVVGSEELDLPTEFGWDMRTAEALSPDDIWIGGLVALSNFWGVPFIAHFNGQQWDWWEGTMLDQVNADAGQVERSGSPSDMVIIAPDDIWLVGNATEFRYARGSALLTHWDGSNLEEFPPIPDVYTRLLNVNACDASGSNDVWAVGEGHTLGPFHMLILHYDGTDWKPEMNWTGLPGQTVYGEHLSDVASISPTDTWAVGDKLVDGVVNLESHSFYLHWDGSAWTEVAGPNIGPLTSITASAPDDIWASCGYGEYGGRLAHYDGTSWTEFESAPIPGATHISLTNLSSSGPCDAWAIGSWGVYDGAGGWAEYHNILEHLAEGGTGTPACAPCDWNASGGVGIDDLLAFLVDFFAGASDYNGDSLTNVNDLLDYLGCYFLPPAGC